MRKRSFDESEPLATTAFDWCALAEYAAVERSPSSVSVQFAGDRAGELRATVVRCLERAGALASEVSAFRAIARIQRDVLGDRDAALHALATSAARLLESDVSSTEWWLLATAWLDHGDRDAALHYLDHAAAIAVSVEHHCDLAAAYHVLGNSAIAGQLAARAEALAIDCAQRCTVANNLRFALDDAEAATAVIQRARDAVTTALDVFHVAAAEVRLRSADFDDEIPIAIGDERLRTFDDWLALHEIVCSSVQPFYSRENCIERATALAVEDAQRERLADSERRMDPTRESFDQIPPAAAFFRRDTCGFAGEPARLLDWLRPRLNDAQLRRLANNDWMPTDEAYATFITIRDTGQIPRPLPYGTRENFELERWSDGTYLEVDHVLRAFACTMLCLAGPGYIGGEHESMAALVESCFVLGPAAIDGLIGLFAAMDDDVFLLLGLALTAAKRDPTDPRLPRTVSRLIAFEAGLGGRRYPGSWLFNTSNFDMRYPMWRSLAQDVLATASMPCLRELADLLDLRSIGT